MSTYYLSRRQETALLRLLSAVVRDGKHELPQEYWINNADRTEYEPIVALKEKLERKAR